MNMCGNIGAAACPLVVPWFVTLTGSEESILFLFAGISLAAALCWIPFDANGMIVPEREPPGESRAS
jgi:nitrate/nitrite transporter NarK